ncbi:PA14 domain-containing protein [Spirosoma gilvum]
MAGLKGEYFDGPNFERKVLTRTDPQVDFNWNWQLAGPGVPHEYFSVRWTGKLYAPTTGKYRFSALVDDGVRVWVGGRKVIDEWRKQDDSQFVGEIELKGQQLYDLRIEYYNDWKGSTISVYWERPEDRRLFGFGSTPHQPIPTKYLFSKPVRPVPTTATLAPRSTLTYNPRSMRATQTASSLATQSTPSVTPIAPTRTVMKTASLKTTAPKSANRLPKLATGDLAAPTLPIQKPTSTPVDQPFANVQVGQPILLRQVLFDQSEYTLLPESYTELDKLVRLLKANPAMRIEIAGHTDDVGDKRLNQTLSEYRAKMVASYLCRQGIADSRITARGYGGTRPIATNTTESQRAQNRRVEFVVLGD